MFHLTLLDVSPADVHAAIDCKEDEAKTGELG